jgi:hypothetical protein
MLTPAQILTRNAKGQYALLVDWGTNHRALGDYFELLEGPFTMAEAESVAKECRRLGAIAASVHKTAAARKLYASDPRGAAARVESPAEDDGSKFWCDHCRRPVYDATSCPHCGRYSST